MKTENGAVIGDWISVDDKLPETVPYDYAGEISHPVLVHGTGKNAYSWVAHLYVDKATSYKSFARGIDKNGVRYTWINPYRDIVDNQKITHWRPI